MVTQPLVSGLMIAYAVDQDRTISYIPQRIFEDWKLTVDELHEIARFFDRHLNGTRNGWEEEPAVVWFEHEYTAPVPFPAELPGRWRAAAAYPHPATTPRSWSFGDGSSVRA